MTNLNSIDVLLVEDNSGEAELIIRELKKNNMAKNLFHLKGGEEALDFIFGTGVRWEQAYSIPAQTHIAGYSNA
jgi:two-component system, response regulator